MAVPRRVLRVVPVLAALGALLVVSVSSVAAAVPRKLVYIDMFGQAVGPQPSHIFLTANAGPYLKGLRWSDWGANRATAKGTYVSTCASCAPPGHRHATVVFHRIINCTSPAGRGGHYRVYKYATLTTEADNHPGTIKTIEIPTNYELCKEYQRQ
jgi:hypothetical protein